MHNQEIFFFALYHQRIARLLDLDTGHCIWLGFIPLVSICTWLVSCFDGLSTICMKALTVLSQLYRTTACHRQGQGLHYGTGRGVVLQLLPLFNDPIVTCLAYCILVSCKNIIVRITRCIQGLRVVFICFSGGSEKRTGCMPASEASANPPLTGGCARQSLSTL